ncbi:MAG: hypothetical protein ACR2HN_09720 [Tepidiformaceae bacterium]
MYSELIDRFGRECARKLWAADPFTAGEFRAFSVLLEARELSGQRLLGKMAGPDPCIDTVSGRCGHPVLRLG